MCNWLVQSWNKITKDQIKKSFQVCGLSVSCIPSDITCLKDGKPVAGGLAEVENLWTKSPEEIGDVNVEEIADEEEDEANDLLFAQEDVEEEEEFM